MLVLSVFLFGLLAVSGLVNAGQTFREIRGEGSW